MVLVELDLYLVTGPVIYGRRAKVVLCALEDACSGLVIGTGSGKAWEREGDGGKVPEQPGAAPRRVDLPSDSPVPGARRVKIRSGPYRVPNMMKTNPTGERGMLWNYPDLQIERPCSGECTLLKQVAGLEYGNGTSANIDTGMWLHHMVAFVSGPTRWDPTCYGKVSLPHWSVSSMPSKTERYFSSGNERSAFRFEAGGNTGYHLGEADVLSWVIELMNMNMDDRVVYVTQTYDYLPGPLPSGWQDIKPVWFDASNCWTGEVAAPKETGAFAIESEPWIPNVEGRIVDAVGHLHDGGIAVDVLASPNQPVCTTNLHYSESPAYIFRGTNMGDDKPAINHISSVERCKVSRIKEMKKGQSWTVRGRYNYDDRPGNIEEGKQGAVMAISIVLIAVPPGGVPSPMQGWIGWAGSMVGIGATGELSPAAPAPVWNNGPSAPGAQWQGNPSARMSKPISAAPGTGEFAPGMGF
ncbi:hypothetical protein BLS_001283 [Venturia inaequalis]|uniref:Uncharacterized protein n=1 Tax=Venturia inaequalis TaxID=5025 RepID=A0A8H3YXL9_VENIN|nr:hypothetical protein BLS_001283 [Venturia inaequalis]